MVRIILCVLLFAILIGLSIPIYSNIEQRINHDLELNEELKKYTQDLPKMLDSVTRLDSIEAYDGEVYYKNSILLDDDTKMDYSKVKQILKKTACNNEAILRIIEEPTLRLINNEGKVHYHYTEENSKKITEFTIKKSDCLLNND